MLIKDEARNAAAATLDVHGSGRFPVDPFAIAHQMRIAVQFLPLEPGVSGMIIAEDGKQPRIIIEITDAMTRQRFTCAHELGHYVERTNRINAPREFAFIDTRSTKKDAREFYADEFAGNLLMPEDEVRSLLAQNLHPIAMAAHFDVSLPALQVRLAILNR